MSIWRDFSFLFCIFSVSSKLPPKKCIYFANKFLLKKNVLFALKKKKAGKTNTRMFSPCASG